MQKFVRSISREPYPHLDDIWYMGRARAEGAHGDLDGGQRSSEVKWGKLCTMATIFGQKKPWCKLRMMVTLMALKGHQRSNGVNDVLWLPYFVKRSADENWEWWWWPLWRSKIIRGQMWKTMWYGYHIWSKEPLMQAKNDDDLHGGQRSSGVKYGNICAMATIFGQKNCWYKLRMMMTVMEVRGHQRSNVVNCATKLGRKCSWCIFRMTDLDGGQRLTEVKYSE